MSASPLSFKELIDLAKAGDREAFDTLYESHLTPVYRYVYVRVRNKEDAEDIVQDTFMKAYQALERYEVTGDNFFPYLFTIARNLLINHGKKKKSEPTPHDVLDRADGGMSATASAEARETHEVIIDAMSVLSDTEREVISLRFLAERSYQDIAKMLDKNPDAIRQHVARAMKKMKQALGSSTQLPHLS